MTTKREPKSAVIDALLKSATTGKPVKLPRAMGGKPVISIDGVHTLIRLGLWAEALQRIVALDEVHIEAQIAFGQAWKRMQFRTGMNGVPDDLFYAGLRKMLPAYNGQEAVTLYRGQDDPRGRVGTSWTERKIVAIRFALFGFEDPEENDPMKGGVVLTATVPASAIICSIHDWVRPGGEREVIIDPRGIDYATEPAWELREVFNTEAEQDKKFRAAHKWLR